MGSETLPSREVEQDTFHCENCEVDSSKVTDSPVPIQVLIDLDQEEQGGLLGELPEPQPNEPDIFTRHTWPENPARVMKILSEVTLGNDITADEKQQLEDFIQRNTDIFTLSLKEVKPIPDEYVNLNVPEAATFNLQIHQRPLTPDQSRFFSTHIDDMLEAGIIKHAPAELIKCAATMVIAQKLMNPQDYHGRNSHNASTTNAELQENNQCLNSQNEKSK